MTPAVIACVAAGGAVGAVMRFLVNTALRGSAGAFPLATLVVNGVGSLVIGLVISWAAAQHGESTLLRSFLQVGLLGSLTTFSSFSAETLMLAQSGRPGLALVNIATNLALALAACAAGLFLGRAIW